MSNQSTATLTHTSSVGQAVAQFRSECAEWDRTEAGLTYLTMGAMRWRDTAVEWMQMGQAARSEAVWQVCRQQRLEAQAKADGYRDRLAAARAANA